MTDDTCGHDTPDGTCGNPVTPDNPEDGDPDRCWIPSHNDPDAENPHGRPSKLDQYESDILTGARQGMTLQGCARRAGVPEQTLHRWKDKYPDFRESLKRARAQGELEHLQSVDDRGSQFILERSFGYVKTERREVEGEMGIEVNLQENVVDTSDQLDDDGDGEE